VRNLLESLKGNQGFGRQAQTGDKPYPFLTHLLPTSITIPMVEAASEEYVNSLLSFLPPSVVALAANPDSDDAGEELSPEAASRLLNLDQKRTLLKKVLRSPQFHQALGSLTIALRDGGLPTVAEALGIKVENGGYVRGGSMPLGGGEAVEAFVQGVKKTVRESR
jgi:26S proteasome regulatory subunit N13